MSWLTAFERSVGTCALAGLSAALLSVSAPAVAGMHIASADKCSLIAFVDETDPAGLNVRAAPDARAQVLGQLPPVWKDPVDGTQVRVRVEVTASQDGWFKIRNGKDEQQLTERPARPTYGGEGWVSGHKLIVKPQATVGYQQPNSESPIGLQLGPEQDLDSKSFRQAARLVACEGEWVRMDFTEARLPADERKQLKIAPAARKNLPAGHFRVWVNQICGSQETACDGP